MLRFETFVIFAVIAAGSAGCSRHSSASAGPNRSTTQPSPQSPSTPAKVETPAVETFEYASAKIKLNYPARWQKRNEPENVLAVSPKADDPAAPELSVAVPKLPFHLPGMIPLDLVKNGYVDDLRKRLTDVKEEKADAVKVAGANGSRRFIAEGKDAKLGDRKLDVLLITKGDVLYVITAESSAADFETAHSAMEGVVSSLEWMK